MSRVIHQDDGPVLGCVPTDSPQCYKCRHANCSMWPVEESEQQVGRQCMILTAPSKQSGREHFVWLNDNSHSEKVKRGKGFSRTSNTVRLEQPSCRGVSVRNKNETCALNFEVFESQPGTTWGFTKILVKFLYELNCASDSGKARTNKLLKPFETHQPIRSTKNLTC